MSKGGAMAMVAAKKNKQKWTAKEEFSRFVEAALRRGALVKSMEDFEGRFRTKVHQSERQGGKRRISKDANGSARSAAR